MESPEVEALRKRLSELAGEALSIGERIPVMEADLRAAERAKDPNVEILRANYRALVDRSIEVQRMQREERARLNTLLFPGWTPPNWTR